MNNNPFTLMYGIPSQSVVSRSDEMKIIIDDFNSNKNMFTYLITGIRGMGKTVLLRAIEEKLNNDSRWIVVNINPQGPILSSLANKLYDIGSIKKIIGNIKLSVNLGVVTIAREPANQITDPEIIIEQLLDSFTKNGLKVLISIDEVNDTHDFREFINFYQTMIAKKHQLYLLMTALKENINTLINDKAMTFLSRAPKIELNPLPLANIATNYSQIFDIDYEDAAKMAKLTNGYAFAYQVLGYFMYESQEKKLNYGFIKQYQNYLFNNGYNKFWTDLTDVERRFMIALALSDGSKEGILERGFSSSNYSQYRKRLIDKGLITMPKHGKLSFLLPKYKEYVLLMKEFEEE